MRCEPTGQLLIDFTPPATCKACGRWERFPIGHRYDTWNPIDQGPCGHLLCLRCSGPGFKACPVCSIDLRF